MKLRRHGPRARTLRPAERHLALGAEEARRARRTFVGTEDVLLALLRIPDGETVRILRRLGVEAGAVERSLSGSRPEGGVNGAKIDPAALETLGIDFEAVRARLERTFGPGALEQSGAACLGIDPQLKRALAHAVDLAGAGAVGDVHVFLGLLSVPDSVAARTLAREGVTLARARAAT